MTVEEYPGGLRLGPTQEQVLRRWPTERIRPKSVALGVRSLLAEVDVLRTERDAAERRVTDLTVAPDGTPLRHPLDLLDDLSVVQADLEAERDRADALAEALAGIDRKLDVARLGLDRNGPQHARIIEARELAREALAASAPPAGQVGDAP